MKDAPTTRYSLLIRLSNANDHVAWSEFVSLYEPAICRFARAMGLQHDDAIEIAQEVLIHVSKLSSNRSMHDIRSFRSWLVVTTRNRVIDMIRHRRRGHQHIAAIAGSMQATDEQQWDRIDQEWGQAVRRQMFLHAADEVRGQVEPKQWQAFIHTAIELQPAANVAARLGMTIGNVYVARCRIIERLRRIVERLSMDDFEVNS